MKEEIIIPVQKEENLVAANKRRDKYAAKRDVQALEFNQAIVTRLLSEGNNQIKCEKCGRQFSIKIGSPGTQICSECSEIIVLD